mgnify:CR=1 FL=1
MDTDTTIFSSTITNCGTGIETVGQGKKNINITGNRLENNTDGITLFSRAENVTIEDNVIKNSNPTYAAILVYPDSGEIKIINISFNNIKYSIKSQDFNVKLFEE